MQIKINQKEQLCKEYYNALIEALKYVAYRCGYALAVHGSLKRDIDLIACPWRDHAVGSDYLIKEIQKATKSIIGEARPKQGEKTLKEYPMPCGRVAYTIYLTHDDSGPYLDVSIMPKGKK